MRQHDGGRALGLVEVVDRRHRDREVAVAERLEHGAARRARRSSRPRRRPTTSGTSAACERGRRGHDDRLRSAPTPSLPTTSTHARAAARELGDRSSRRPLSNPRNPACCEHGEHVVRGVAVERRACSAGRRAAATPSARSVVLVLRRRIPSAVCSAFTSSSLASAHLSSSQSVPVTVASACWRRGIDRLDAVAVDAAHRDDTDVVADEPVARPRTAAGRSITPLQLRRSRSQSPSFSPWMRSDFALHAC